MTGAGSVREPHPEQSSRDESAELDDEGAAPASDPSPPNRSTLLRHRRSRLVPALWYAAVAMYGLWPLLPHLSTRLNADQTDGAGFIWAFLEVPSRLAHLENPFASSRMFFPVGADLSFDTTAPVVGVVVALLLPVLGLALAVNVSTLVGGALSGIAAHLIARHAGASRSAAYLTGTVFVLLPSRYERQGTHFNFFHTEFLAFGLLALLKLRDDPTLLRSLAFGSLFGLTYLNDVTYGVVLTLFCVALLVSGHHWRSIGVRSYGASALAALPLCGPLLLAQLASVLREGGGQTVGDGGVERYSSDVLSWLLPPAWHPLWGHVASSRFGPMNVGEPVAYVGLSVLLLAAFGVWRGARAKAGWIVCALGFGVLSLGPFLKIGGRTGSGFTFGPGISYRVPLPFLLLRRLPLVDGLRAPGRFAVPAGLAVAVLASLGLTALAARHSRLRHLPLLAVLLVIVELPADATPYAMPARAPQPYRAIAHDPGVGAVLELPLLWGDGLRGVGSDPSGLSPEVFRFWNRSSHSKPIVSGHVARVSDQRLDQLTSFPAYRTILALEGQPGFADERALTVAELHQMGIGYVVYHRDHPAPTLWDRVRLLDLQVLADDGTVVAWRVP